MGLDRLTGLFRKTSNGGAFVPSADYEITGQWNFRTAVGFRQRVVASPAPVFKLPPALSGALMLFDRTTGGIYQLPAPEPELVFEFLTTVSLASGTFEIQANVPNVFLQGNVLSGLVNITPSAGAGPKYFASVGVTNTRVAMNGGTTGGLRGCRLRAICLSPTLWQIDGVLMGTGAIDTPFLA